MQGPAAADPYRVPAEYYPAPQGGGIDIKDLISILRRRRWVIFSTVLLITTLAVLMGLQVTPRYTAQSMVMIDPRQSQVVDVESVMQGLGTDTATVESQIRLIKSRGQIEAVMGTLNLFDDPEFNPAVLEPDREVAMRVEGPLQGMFSWLPDEWLIATGIAQEPEALLPGMAPELEQEAAIARFNKGLKVSQEGRSYVIAISFTSTSPQKAAIVANQAAELYVQAQVDTKRGATEKASGWLEERLEELQIETERAEQAVERFRVAKSLPEDIQGVSLKEQRLYSLNDALSALRADLAGQQAKIKLISGLRGRGRGLDSIQEVLGSATIIDLRAREAELLREESELLSTFGDKHPRIVNLRAEKQSLADKLQAEVDRILTTISNDVEVTQSRIASIEQQIAEVQQGTSLDRETGVTLRQLEREASATRNLYESFLTRYKETREQLSIVEADAKVISASAPPGNPSTPGAKLFGAVGFTASLMLGTLLALLLERLDSGMRSTKQIEGGLGLPALGLVPRLERLRRGQKPHQYLIAKPLSAYSEAIRAIYTSMQLSDVDHPPKIVLVTSALPQEGKTTLAVSLATFAARSAQRVLLFDLDLRHPSIQRELGVAPTAGFVEFMAGEKTLEEVIQHDEASGLYYFPIKKQPANPTDLISSQKMKQLIALLRDSFDYVVIDSAPLVGVTDTKVAALLADKVIFATQWDKTTKDTALAGLAHLNEVKASIAGVVLTQVDVNKHAQYGYGDVGQYYGKYQKYYVN